MRFKRNFPKVILLKSFTPLENATDEVGGRGFVSLRDDDGLMPPSSLTGFTRLQFSTNVLKI